MVGRSWLVHWSSMVNGSSMVNRGSMVDGSSMVSRGSMVHGRLVLIIMSLTRVLDISNIATVGIIHFVVDSLSSAIRKSNRVGSRGSISISVLSILEVGSRVVISYSIVEGINSRFIIAWLFVGRCSMIGRSRSIPAH